MRITTIVLSTILLATTGAAAEDRLVGPGQPYSTIGDALADAASSDVIIVSAGTYREALATATSGVTIRAVSGDEVIVQTAGRVLDVQHDDTTVEGLIIDGDYGDRSPVRVQANGFTLLGSEVRRSTRDCVALGSVSDVLIEETIIHRCLASASAGCADPSCREDAHGVSGGAVRGVVIRNSSIHTFSGDALQIDPGRDDAGWSDVTLDGCRLYLSPLASAEGGFAAGVVPGENAIDTKTSPAVTEPAVLTVTNTFAWGFGGGLISNMAAFNIKENVRAAFDGVHVYDSEIAFRLRGATGSVPRGARVAIANAVIFRVDTAVRYEDDIMPVQLYSSTFGEGIGRAFQRASAPEGVIEADNLLFLAGTLPDEAMGGASMAVDASVFVNVADDDYHLEAGSSPIDVGTDLSSVVMRDRDGNARPLGDGHDVGAYEWCDPSSCAPAPDAGTAPPDAGGPGRDGSVGPDGSAGDAGGDGGGPAGMDDGGCCRAAGGGRQGEAIAVSLVLLLLLGRRRTRARSG